jgi:hypothetical protein
LGFFKEDNKNSYSLYCVQIDIEILQGLFAQILESFVLQKYLGIP